MAARSLGRARRIWFYVHMWIGVGLAVLLIPLSASGSYLDWRDEIERAIHPARYAVSAGPANLAPQAYLDAAQAAFGDKARASSLRLPARAGDPVTVTGVIRSDRGAAGAGPAPRRQPTLTAWIDPATAKVLDTANPREGLSMWMHDLHGQFFVFGTGRLVVGWFGVAMFVSCLSGLWLWWPRGGGVLAGFRWRRSGDLMVNLHYLAGFWVAIPLAVLCLTGALISFPQFTRGAVGAFKPVSAQQGRGPGGPGGPGGAPMRRTALTIDEAATLALQAQPNTTLAAIDLPTRGRGAPSWRVQLRGADGATKTLQVADEAGGAVRAAPERVVLEGDKLIRLNRTVHGGERWGLLWKWIATAAGLVPALLGVTGVVVWARRQLRKARLRARLPNANGEPVGAEVPAE
jgi:uncharacterized iron-regulated membrane protein